MATARTPEQQRRRRIFNLVVTGLKLVFLGMVFLFALDNAKPLAVTIGVLAEIGAVYCFVKAYRLARPRPARPAEAYADLQDAMAEMRRAESGAPAELSRRAPLEPR